MSFTLTAGLQGNCQTAQVVWSVNAETYNFRSDNNFLSWISTIFTVADVVASAPVILTNPLILPDGGDALGYSLNTLNNDSSGGGINLSGASGDVGAGGSILMNAGYTGNAGSINTSSNDGATGGSINTNSDEEYNGGNINTFGGGTGDGGSIDTSDGGGSIVTNGQGSIGLGVANNGNQTLITGTATTSNKTATFPDNSGTIALVLQSAVSITFGVCAGNGAVVASSQTVTGASVGDAVLITCTTNRTTLTAGATSNIIFDGLVTASDTVSVRAHNPHANSITLGALDFKIIVFKL